METNNLAGRTVRLKEGVKLYPEIDIREFRVEDWWINVYGKSWKDSSGNIACMNYAMRSGGQNPPLPMDDKVLYGKVGPFGYLVHESEIEDGS